ncbi:MAG: hypothetical protein MI673_05360 [Thiotrichales bacterium]|nr:hypothetical protein [Thiotrichales bacterium]
MILFFSSLIFTTNLPAEINDYFIRRMILYESDCTLDELERTRTKKGGLDFHATCKNVSFYPNGLQVHCDNEDDETTCQVLTESREFNSLDILQRSRSNATENMK